MFASLPWYDVAEARPFTDAWWRVLRRHLREHGFAVGDELERTIDYERQWTSGELLLSQACGYDVRLAFAAHLRLLLTPCHAAPGCCGPTYSSFVAVREDAPWGTLVELRGARCVVNTATSHSGMNILRAMVAPLHAGGRFFASVTVSGSHRDSLAAIVRGNADVAAIDCVTWALLQRHAPRALSGVRVLCRTRELPAPPYVTRLRATAAEVERLRTALRAAAADPEGASVRPELFLSGFEELPLDAYDSIAELQRVAEEQGYFELHPRIGVREDQRAYG